MLSPKAFTQAVLDLAETLPASKQGQLVDAVIQLLTARGERHLLRILPSVLRAASAKRHGITALTLVTPTGKDLSSLKAALEKTLGEVAVTETADVTLLGGAVLTVGDERIDATLLTQLHKAAAQLSSSHV